MSVIKMEIGTIENVKENEVIPQMLIVPTGGLEKQEDGTYRDSASDVILKLDDNRFLVAEINGFTYTSVINPSYEDGVENFDSGVNQRNNKIGFVLSDISKEKISEGVNVETVTGDRLAVVDWFTHYDSDNYLSGMKCVQEGKVVVVPVDYYGFFQFSVPSCSRIVGEALSQKEKGK